MKITALNILLLTVFSTAYAETDLHSYQLSSSPVTVTVDKSDLSEVVVDTVLGSATDLRRILPTHSFSIGAFSTKNGEARVDVETQFMGLDCNSEKYFCEIELYVNDAKVIATVAAGSNEKVVNPQSLPAEWELNSGDLYNNIKLKKPVTVTVGKLTDKNEIAWSVPAKSFILSLGSTAKGAKTDPAAPLCAKNSMIGSCVSKFPVIIKLNLSSTK